METIDSVNRDIEHMRDVLRQADNVRKLSGRVVVMFVSTPFSPEPLTPMQKSAHLLILIGDKR